MFDIFIKTHFAGAHHLRDYPGDCELPHGHNWKVEVCVGGEKLNQAGVLIDFGILKSHVHEIIQRLDHCFLNELDCFNRKAPSSENIAVFIADELKEKLDDPNVHVTRVTTWESEDACSTYIP